MKKIIGLLAALGLITSLNGRAQAPVKVMVYPGTELLQVIHLLSDTARMAQSTYNAEVRHYFRAYKRHPAVLKARALPQISCDFPVRLSWAFYHFPDIKVAAMKQERMDGYEDYFNLGQMQAYFEECARFYKDSHFWTFYQAHAPAYAGWVAGFERGLYRDGMLADVDNFYRLKRDKPVVITLGPLNCGSYAMSDLRGINPNLPDQHTIMVAYSQAAGNKDTVSKAPSFYAPAKTAQLVWHELGHTYLRGVFQKHQREVEALAYFMAQDSAVKKNAGYRGGWANYLNENTTQAVTSLLLIRTGKAARQAEVDDLKPSADNLYSLSAEMLGIIEQKYYRNPRYQNFEQFFPVLLAEMKKNHPPR